jgi:hypothetical protein
LETLEGKYHMEGLEIDGRAIFEKCLMAIRLTN